MQYTAIFHGCENDNFQLNFTIQKWGVKGVYITRTCYSDEHLSRDVSKFDQVCFYEYAVREFICFFFFVCVCFFFFALFFTLSILTRKRISFPRLFETFPFFLENAVFLLKIKLKSPFPAILRGMLNSNFN